jgi:hypothetical protein
MQILRRSLQWAGPVALVALWWLDEPLRVTVPIVMIVLVLSALAKRRADLHRNLNICHANMRAYIEAGGLNGPAEPRRVK